MSFDTIRFRLKNLDYYESIAVNFERGEKVSVGGMRFVLSKRGAKEVIKETHYTKAKLTSASYDINYDINQLDNYVIFEFSIPKYVYGHNLEHFPPSKGDEYNDLKRFLNRFFMDEFKCNLRFSDIQIMRIDLCYNYHFESIQNKEAYFDILHDQMKKEFSRYKIESRGENETIMFKTNDYSFKIYDKSKEFIKHDYKKIVKLKGVKYANELLLKSQTILRHEVTLRDNKISYEYFNNFESFAKNEMILRRFKGLKRIYIDCVSVLDYVTNVSNRFLDNKYSENEFIDKLNEYQNSKKYMKYSDKDIDVVYKMIVKNKENGGLANLSTMDMNMIISKKHRASMSAYLSFVSPKPVLLQFNETQKILHRSATQVHLIEFDEKLLSKLFILFENYITKINEFDLGKMSPLRVLYYNRKTLEKHGINVTPLKKYLAILETMNESEIKQKKIYSLATLKRYKAQMKQINQLLRDEHNSTNSLFAYDIREKVNINKIYEENVVL